MQRGRVRFTSRIFSSYFMKIIHSPLGNGYMSKVLITDTLKTINKDKYFFLEIIS